MAINPLDVRVEAGNEYGVSLSYLDDSQEVTKADCLSFVVIPDRDTTLASALSEHIEETGVDLGAYVNIAQVINFTQDKILCDCDDASTHSNAADYDNESDDLISGLSSMIGDGDIGFLDALISDLQQSLGISDAELAEMEKVAAEISGRRR